MKLNIKEKKNEIERKEEKRIKMKAKERGKNKVMNL